MISVWSWKLTCTILFESLNMIACFVRIHFFTNTVCVFCEGYTNFESLGPPSR